MEFLIPTRTTRPADDPIFALNAEAKPASAKGIFVQKVSLSSTMGVGVIVDPSSLPLK